MSGHIGLIELILVFAAVLGLAVWDLMATKRASATEPPPDPKLAAKQRGQARTTNGKPRAKPKPRAKSPSSN